MKLVDAVEKLEGAVRTVGCPDSTSADYRTVLHVTTQLDSFLASIRAEAVRALKAEPAAFPEAAIADTSGCNLGAATKETERADTLGSASAFDEALSDGQITTAHVDALTKATRNLDADAAQSLLDQNDELAQAAAALNVRDFSALLNRKARQLDKRDGEERLAQQQRSTRLSTWTDNEGMFNLKGCFDPDTGRKIARRLAEATRSKFAEELPATAPDDTLERSRHLEALALADIITGDAAPSGRAGAPLVVIDASQSNGAGGPVLDWGIPVELPERILHDVLDAQTPDAIVVCNGVVLHATGTLDLGRTSRLASPAQRRALQAMYSTCAVPGCAAHYDRCRLHHIVFWHDGGRTDLANLLPVCQHHHTRIHTDNWHITLGPNRELMIRLPDGQVLKTGPPKRSAA